MDNLLVQWVKATHGINLETLSLRELEELFDEAGVFGEAQQDLDNAVEQEIQRRRGQRNVHLSTYFYTPNTQSSDTLFDSTQETEPSTKPQRSRFKTLKKSVVPN
ncbi:hypothetical protein KFU94_42145 [Chloroflexi bacterium TSY]|nr:hypothetical protein [Chloroflexi bacterium TSY]